MKNLAQEGIPSVSRFISQKWKFVQKELPVDTPAGVLKPHYEYELKNLKQEILLSREALCQKAQKELDKNGITSEQKEAYSSESKRLFQTVAPWGYGDKAGKLWSYISQKPSELRRHISKNLPERDDAWAMYLGLPQQYKTFRISKYAPSKSNEKKYYYALPKEKEVKILRAFFHELDPDKIQERIQKEQKNIVVPDFNPWEEDVPVGISDEAMTKQSTSQYVISQLKERAHSKKMVVYDDYAFVMGNSTFAFGEDEKGRYISYYDVWDLAPTGEEIKSIGKPFEIYNRIYYNPKTGERKN